MSTSSTIRIPCLHPKAILPPGRAFEAYGGERRLDLLIATTEDGQSVLLQQYEGDAARSVSGWLIEGIVPTHIPGDLTGAEAMAVLRALAERFPEHVTVAVDEIRSRLGEPDVNGWRHPDDVEAIELAWIAVGLRDALGVVDALVHRIPLTRRWDIADELAKRDKGAAGGGR